MFVAPSTGQESFGIVLLEAMSVARPIVCSDIAGYRQVILDEGAELVPPRDSAGLARAIATLVRDPARRMRMGELNRAHAQQFDWDVLARDYADTRASGQSALSAAAVRSNVEGVEL